MAMIPNRIVQTSTEAKKQYKKAGIALPARQQKQLERGLELDERAARFRQFEEKRKAAKKKRQEKEAKEERARQQMGVGLATQMIGYNHTQAQMKNGMEAFLGVQKPRDKEQHKPERELSKNVESIAREIENEPWDDDEADDIALNMTEADSSSGQQWVDDDIDDDSLLQAHDLVMSDPVEGIPVIVHSRPATAPPVVPTSPSHTSTKNGPTFVRTHGPTNKAVEAILDRLPEELVELLSQDISMNLPDWSPAPGLLHKLNPVGLPPHRLRIKVGCTVTLLRDLNTSSQLSKSQHLRILRANNDRLECLVLDGPLEGAKTILTRVPFLAKYRNQDQYPFRRTQFPIRIATHFTPASIPGDIAQSGFKLPAIPGRLPTQSLPKRVAPVLKVKPQVHINLGFGMPGLPASKSSIPDSPPIIATAKPVTSIPSTIFDGWDDFLESGTQIARELSLETDQPLARSPVVPVTALPANAELLAPMSTQDLDFSMDDLDEDAFPEPPVVKSIETVRVVEKAALPGPIIKAPAKQPGRAETDKGPLAPRTNPPAADPRRRKSPGAPPKIAGRSKAGNVSALAIDLRNLRPSQKPPSVGDRPGLKRKAQASLAPPAKKHCAPASRPVLPTKSVKATMAHNMDEFRMSTQDAASFFDDLIADDPWNVGAPLGST